MKKLLLVLAIASFAACNDAGTGEEKPADSTAAAPVDSSAMAPAPAQDSAAMAPATDTTKKDTTIKK
jgi:hypothetical protein